MPTETDKKALAEAKRLARTGKYLTWWAIEKELEGAHPQASKALADRRVQEELNRLCAEAMKKKDA